MKDTTAEHKLKVSDIDASLNYGKIYTSKAWDATFIVMLILSVLVMVFAVVGLFDKPYDSNSKFMIVFGFVFGGFMLLVTLLLFLYINRGKKKATLWLKDAVLLEARCTLLDTSMQVRRSVVVKAAAIRVKFTYNGKKYTKESSYKGTRAYLPVFNKYADKKITIAYSPKYDQVMLVKDNKK